MNCPLHLLRPSSCWLLLRGRRLLLRMQYNALPATQAWLTDVAC